MDYLTKKTSNLRPKDRHKMTSYFFAVPKHILKGKTYLCDMNPSVMSKVVFCPCVFWGMFLCLSMTQQTLHASESVPNPSVALQTCSAKEGKTRNLKSVIRNPKSLVFRMLLRTLRSKAERGFLDKPCSTILLKDGSELQGEVLGQWRGKIKYRACGEGKGKPSILSLDKVKAIRLADGRVWESGSKRRFMRPHPAGIAAFLLCGLSFLALVILLGSFSELLGLLLAAGIAFGALLLGLFARDQYPFKTFWAELAIGISLGIIMLCMGVVVAYV